MENTINSEIIFLSEDEKIKEYKLQLAKLRENGSKKLSDLNERKDEIKMNRLLSKEEKQEKLAKIQIEMAAAREDMVQKTPEIIPLVNESVMYALEHGKENEDRVNTYNNELMLKLKEEHKANMQSILKKHKERMTEIKALKETSVEEYEIALREEKMSHRAQLHDEKSSYQTKYQKCKDNMYATYCSRRNTVRELRDGKQSFYESMEFKMKTTQNTFQWKKFLLSNALYITIIFVYIICFIASPLTGNGNLLSLSSISNVLEQSSTRMFYALGVAGLILLAGTDLSVGRMIALGSITTAVILHDGTNIVTFFGLPALDFTPVPWAIRVLLALVLSITLCTAFSALAGFFTAKFKMHPFITTLSTQLLIYGLIYFSTTGKPTGGVASSVYDVIGGGWDLGIFTLYKTTIYAIIAIAVVWFIWNKTKFGKNMYAVGGNAEAAAVSGISVFWTTLGVFIMAGILYGFGSFFEAFRANSSGSTGQGWELDAIAACVVGGISFNGGIGKIRGAVLGVIIFTGLTYCLSYLGVDTNLQFIFKGIIIMSACALDSVKYLKKK